MTTRTIKIFTCGGTIDKVYFDAKSSFQVGEPQIASILKEANVTIPYDIESLFREDSLDLNDAHRELVRLKVLSCPFDRILITHGTDSMVTTARALLGVPYKTIVLTGSMEPARFRVSDAPFNVGTAIACVQVLPPGVYISMNGHIFDPAETQKNTAAGRFEGKIANW